MSPHQGRLSVEPAAVRPPAPSTVRCHPLLRTARDVAPALLLLGWQSVWGVDDGLTELAASTAGLTCTVDGVACGLATVPGPLPGQQVLAAADASWLWPEGGLDAASCAAHAIVWAAHAAEPARAHAALSRLVAAALPVLGSPGVHVPAAGMLVRSDLWTGLTQQSPLPLLLWVQLDCRPEPTGTSALTTTGLASFGLPEVEVAGSSRTSADLRSWAAEMVGWLVSQQPDLHDGDTLGISADERLLVRFARSVLNRPDPVLRLVDGG